MFLNQWCVALDESVCWEYQLCELALGERAVATLEGVCVLTQGTSGERGSSYPGGGGADSRDICHLSTVLLTFLDYGDL